jgi:7-keto-8-aminopelargonate synthetase-like enzyme
LDLERLISQPHTTGKTLVVTDGVFSMDGDVAPLADMVRFCNRCGALLMVDDAHGTGVLGDHGRGSLELWGIDDPGIVQVGTFSKALGGLGGFVAGTKELIEYLKNRVRTLIYSTGLPSSVASANREALRLVEEEPERRIRLRNLSLRLRKGLDDLGFSTGDDGTPIVPLIIGEPGQAVRVSEALFEAGILAPAIRPPSVPDGASRIRFSLMALHGEEHVDRLLEVISWAYGV